MGENAQNKIQQLWDTILIVVNRFPIIFGLIVGIAFVKTGAYDITTRKIGQGIDYITSSEAYQTNLNNLRDWMDE